MNIFNWKYNKYFRILEEKRRKENKVDKRTKFEDKNDQADYVVGQDIEEHNFIYLFIYFKN